MLRIRNFIFFIIHFFKKIARIMGDIWSYSRNGGKKKTSIPDSHESDLETGRQCHKKYFCSRGRENRDRLNSAPPTRDKSRIPVRTVSENLPEQSGSSSCRNLHATGSRNTAIRSGFNSIYTENMNSSSVRGTRQQRNCSVEHGDVRTGSRNAAIRGGFNSKGTENINNSSVRGTQQLRNYSVECGDVRTGSRNTAIRSGFNSIGTENRNNSSVRGTQQLRNYSVEHGKVGRLHRETLESKPNSKECKVKTPKSQLIRSDKIRNEITVKKSNNQNYDQRNSDYTKRVDIRDNINVDIYHKQPIYFLKSESETFPNILSRSNLNYITNNSIKAPIKRETQNSKYPTTACKQQLGDFQRTGLNTFATLYEDKNLAVNGNNYYKTERNTGGVKATRNESKKYMEYSELSTFCKEAPLNEARSGKELSDLAEGQVFARSQQYLETPQPKADQKCVHKMITQSIENMKIQKIIDEADDKAVSKQASLNKILNSNPSQQNNRTQQTNADQISFHENVTPERENISIDSSTEFMQCEDQTVHGDLIIYDENNHPAASVVNPENKSVCFKYGALENEKTANNEHTPNISNQHSGISHVRIDPKKYHSNEHRNMKQSANGMEKYENNNWDKNIDQQTNENDFLHKFEQTKTNILPYQNSYNLRYGINDDESIHTVNTPPNTFREHGSVSDINVQQLRVDKPSILSPVEKSSRSYMHVENSLGDAKLLVQKSPRLDMSKNYSDSNPCRELRDLEGCIYENLLKDRRTDIDLFEVRKSDQDHNDLQKKRPSSIEKSSNEALNPAANIMSEEQPESQSCDNGYVSLQNRSIQLNKNRSKDQIDKQSIRPREPNVAITNKTLAMRIADERNEESTFSSKISDLFSKVSPYEEALNSYMSEPDDRKYHYIEENLLRIIFKLDKLKIDHSEKLRSERKEVIIYVNGLLDVLDQVRKKNIIR